MIDHKSNTRINPVNIWFNERSSTYLCRPKNICIKRIHFDFAQRTIQILDDAILVVRSDLEWKANLTDIIEKFNVPLYSRAVCFNVDDAMLDAEVEPLLSSFETFGGSITELTVRVSKYVFPDVSKYMAI